MKHRPFLWLLAIMTSTTLFAQLPAGMPQPVFLWPNGVPGALGHSEADIPRMYPFLPLPELRFTSTAVLVIPGGGYQHVAIGHEGVQIAAWLNLQGIPAFVLDYRVAPYHYPAPIEDGQRAMRLIIVSASGDSPPEGISPPLWARTAMPTPRRSRAPTQPTRRVAGRTS
jgi:hypothetical protein